MGEVVAHQSLTQTFLFYPGTSQSPERPQVLKKKKKDPTSWSQRSRDSDPAPPLSGRVWGPLHAQNLSFVLRRVQAIAISTS